MNFKQAKILIEKNSHIIGKLDKGLRIDELFMIPSNPNKAEIFLAKYQQDLDSNAAILEFHNEELEIFVLFNKNLIEETGNFLISSIESLDESIGAVRHL